MRNDCIYYIYNNNKGEKMISGFLIKVKYCGPTDYRGTRWKASFTQRYDEKPIYIYHPQDYSVDGTENAILACNKLIEKHSEKFVVQDTLPTIKAQSYCQKNGEYVFVCNLLKEVA